MFYLLRKFTIPAYRIRGVGLGVCVNWYGDMRQELRLSRR